MGVVQFKADSDINKSWVKITRTASRMTMLSSSTLIKVRIILVTHIKRVVTVAPVATVDLVLIIVVTIRATRTRINTKINILLNKHTLLRNLIWPTALIIFLNVELATGLVLTLILR